MKQRVISFHYTLTNPKGEKLDSSRNREPLSFLEGVGQIIPGLESELGQMKAGDKKRVEVPAAQAYGLPDAEMIMEVPRDRLPTKEVKVGDQFRTSNHPTPLKVTKVTASHVTLDANHPLAGVDLTFDVEVMGMREATEEELASAHQCCGNHSHGCCGEKEDHGHDHSHGGGCCGEEEGKGHKHSGGCCH